VATGHHVNLSLASALQPWLEMVLMIHYIKPEREAEEAPGFCSVYTTCQSMPLCSNPATKAAKLT